VSGVFIHDREYHGEMVGGVIVTMWLTPARHQVGAHARREWCRRGWYQSPP
jgi:hypothetical protein